MSIGKNWYYLLVLVAGFLFFTACKKEEQCRDLMACSMQGRCTNQGDLCVASSDTECKQSSGCKKNGFCRAVDGRCMR